MSVSPKSFYSLSLSFFYSFLKSFHSYLSFSLNFIPSIYSFLSAHTPAMMTLRLKKRTFFGAKKNFFLFSLLLLQFIRDRHKIRISLGFQVTTKQRSFSGIFYGILVSMPKIGLIWCGVRGWVIALII